MDGYQPSSRTAHPAQHLVAPLMPVRDGDDLRMRVQNYLASAKCCPTSWRNYFDALAKQMETEME